MTFPDAFVEACKWFGYLVQIVATIFFIGAPIVEIFTDEDEPLKYPLQMFIIGIISALFLVAYIVYKTNKGI